MGITVFNWLKMELTYCLPLDDFVFPNQFRFFLHLGHFCGVRFSSSHVEGMIPDAEVENVLAYSRTISEYYEVFCCFVSGFYDELSIFELEVFDFRPRKRYGWIQSGNSEELKNMSQHRLQENKNATFFFGMSHFAIPLWTLQKCFFSILLHYYFEDIFTPSKSIFSIYMVFHFLRNHVIFENYGIIFIIIILFQ